MALSWNEIKKRAIEFSKSWEGVEREKAEAQTFWNEFFEVFGQTRRRVAVLEQEVQKLDASKGYIDLFWPKVLLAEAKSKGKDLVKASVQTFFLVKPSRSLAKTGGDSSRNSRICY